MAREWYKNLPLVAGLGLILLGAGNWATGTVRLREHAAVATSAPSDEPSAGARPAKDPEVELAQVRMDFYHVVASGGPLDDRRRLHPLNVWTCAAVRPRGKEGVKTPLLPRPRVP